MTAIDYWPDEDTNPIVTGVTIGFIKASNTVTAGKPQKLGTGGVGYVNGADAGAATGDANLGIALKDASSGQYYPVCVYGVCKCECDGGTNIATGDFVYNEITTNDLIECNTTSTNYHLFGSNYYVLGMMLQPSEEDGDECLVLIGKCI